MTENILCFLKITLTILSTGPFLTKKVFYKVTLIKSFLKRIVHSEMKTPSCHSMLIWVSLQNIYFKKSGFYQCSSK